MLRDCPLTTQIWIRLVPLNQISNFFSFDCRDWIFKNINHQLHRIQNKKWRTIFMVACWLIWKWRNKTIFKDDFQSPSDHTYMIIKMIEDIDKYTQHPLIVRQCSTIFVGWKRPQEGWLILTMIELTKILKLLLVVVEHVTLSMLKCGKCTWECSFLTDKVSTIFKWKVT